MSIKLRRQLRPMIAIVLLGVIAGVVGMYILREQRLRLPFDDLYTVQAELSTAQALTPGQGQAVTVAGVKIGEIAKVSLRDGRALVELSIERDRLPGGVHDDATMLVRPRTPLQDMTVDIDPGSDRAPRLDADDVLGVERTTPQVNLDEVLASLDRDTQDYARTLVGGLGDAIRDRGDALRAALRASAPTLRSTREVTRAVSARRRELARAVSSLRELTDAVARDERSLGRLVTAGDATFGALGGEEAMLRAGLQRLPGTLQAAETALRETEPLATSAAPALRGLVPTARRLPATLRAVDPLVRDGRPALEELRGLSTEARPLAGDLAAAATNLTTATPDLTRTFDALREFTNIFGHNPAGKEEGYLFWASWFAHNGNSFTSGQDGNGPFWRGGAILSCSSLLNNPLAITTLGPAIDRLDICPQIPGNP